MIENRERLSIEESVDQMGEPESGYEVLSAEDIRYLASEGAEYVGRLRRGRDLYLELLSKSNW